MVKPVRHGHRVTKAGEVKVTTTSRKPKGITAKLTDKALKAMGK